MAGVDSEGWCDISASYIGQTRNERVRRTTLKRIAAVARAVTKVEITATATAATTSSTTAAAVTTATTIIAAIIEAKRTTANTSD